MKLIIFLAIVAIFSIILGYLSITAYIVREVDYGIYKCNQDWAKKIAELRTQNKILEFKYESLKYECKG